MTMEMLENLEAVLREVEGHIAAAGWDQPARLFALVSTSELIASDPELAIKLNLSLEKPLTSIEQELFITENLEDLLGNIMWPVEVVGAILAIERIVLPKRAEEDLPQSGDQELVNAALEHPDRLDIRIISAVLRSGENLNALRYRSHDNPESVSVAPDLVSKLNESLLSTFQD